MNDDLGCNLARVLPWFPHEKDSPYVLVRVSEEHAKAWADSLGLPVRRCYVSDSIINARAKQAAVEKSEVVAARLPDPGATMAGDFGEILVYLYQGARELPAAAVGPRKWRLKQDRTKPAPHSDVVHFVLPSWPTSSPNDVILCSEVKTKSTKSTFNPINKAIADSAKDRTSRLARTLVWLRERALTEPLGDVQLGQLERFINATDHPRATKRYRAVAVICNSLVDEELKNAPDTAPLDYSVVVIAVPDLRKTYSAVFEAAKKAIPADSPHPSTVFPMRAGGQKVRASLERWISDADALRHLEHFQVQRSSLDLSKIQTRADDYYLALVGELFSRMHEEAQDEGDWARLGNALAQLAAEPHDDRLKRAGVSTSEAALFGAAAFYCGGFPASAYLTVRGAAPHDDSETHRACFDLMARPSEMTSQVGRTLVEALRRGDMETLARIGESAILQSASTLQAGPHAWIPARLLEQLTKRFLATNVRAVLPNGETAFWTPFVGSLLDRRPAAWEFFPSQIDAIRRGLLERTDTFSLQMPTGAGKTALCETLLYWHARTTESEVAILLVPYRSLASELRSTVVKRLNALGISARCTYGGSVPSGDEVRDLDETRVVVATPEALSGLLGAGGEFFRRVSLVICDEGHLLDGGGRGIGLELLLARMRAREGGAPRFVFVSAIVPNIEEINAWLGGTADGVVRSDYRPALAEYAVLRCTGKGTGMTISLEMHPHEPRPTRFRIQGFLSRADFLFTNEETSRQNTYGFSSIKTQAIATARKALAMGSTAVFAANKRGDQGAIGLAEELVNQLDRDLTLPRPIDVAVNDKLVPVVQYLELEYGTGWLGTRVVAAGAVLHHGDVPQETREVLEDLLRRGDIRFVICTTTLAEGVNLPIRTLVLYSVQRRQKSGRPESLLARDIKNLVGRAGRAGSTTKGLVICANEKQWGLVEQVARQIPGEAVRGALRALVERLRQALAGRTTPLTNADIEAAPVLHTLVDGIDATLVDLAAEEIGEDALVAEAVRLADQTFASQQADAASKQILQTVFALRAGRVLGIRAVGRLDWIRETGARPRMLDAVEAGLLGRRSTWDDVVDPVDPGLVGIMLEWAWGQPEVQQALREAYRLESREDTTELKKPFFDTVSAWLRGARFQHLAPISKLSLDDLLSVHGRVVSYVLQTLVEQGVALLGKLLDGQNRTLAPAVLSFPEHLRFGVPTAAARVLASGGVRHRSAAVELGNALHPAGQDRSAIFVAAREGLLAHAGPWRHRLGTLVYENTIADLSSALGDKPERPPQ